MSHGQSRSGSPGVRSTTNSNDPRDLERRIFVGNLPTTHMERKDLEEMFSPYGKIHALSLFTGYGFVQFERVEDAEAAKAGHKGRMYKGYKIDVNMAAERRTSKPQSRPSPPRRNPYGGYGEGREPRPRSRSPMHGGRDGRDHRDGREPRPGGHPREHEPRGPSYDRYRGSQSREKDPRDPREPPFRGEGYGRFYRGAGPAGPDDYYHKKEDPYRDPWNGRREPEEERAPPEERRRNELYRQYYQELQRRYDSERPVDCSVIVVNKAQNREYAETVGRKVRDLGMVVDLIFLNTEVSLTQALEDVGRARTPFAIIITQQHQVHRSCTVNILFGTPQEHRNMPMEDAMVLVAHNYESYKVENRDKEREETARKAAKMADDVLLREPDGERHPVNLLPTITLLSESRFVTPEELESLISYLRSKRERLIGTANPHTAVVHPTSVAPRHEAPPAQIMPPSSHPGQGHLPPPHPSHMSLPPPSSASSSSNPPVNPNHQQELQAKILSLFNSGSGAMSSAPSPSMPPPAQSYPSSLGGQQPPPPSMVPAPPLGARPPMHPGGGPPGGPPPGYGPPPPGRMPAPQGGPRPSGADINFDNPSVQKALDTLMQSGPALNHMVSPGSSAPRPGQGMGQGMGQPPPMYNHHYYS